MVTERGVDARRWLVIAALVPATMIPALLLLYVASVSTFSGIPLELAGVVAAAAVLAVVALQTRRRT